MPSAFASPRSEYDQLHAKYLVTRNRDARVEQPEKWRVLADQYKKFREKYERNEVAALAAYDESVLWQALYKKQQQDEFLENCKLALYSIVEAHAAHALADDALLRLGDIAHRFEDSPVDAEGLYAEVLRLYPKSDMALVASERLAALEEGTPILENSPKSEQEDTSPTQEMAPLRLQQGKQTVVVLDPGHGGEDFGAVGTKGLLEKDVVLSIATELETLLENNLQLKVHLTRRKDVFIPLEKRTKFANKVGADLFVSLHANASESKTLSGMEVYYLDNTGDAGSLKLAERENAYSPFADVGGDLQFILSDLIQTAKYDDSVILGQTLYGSMLAYLNARWPDIQGLGVKKAPFYVLVGAHMPCVLIEMFFIDHRLDGPRLASPRFRQDLTNALYLGIEKYLLRQREKSAG